MSTLHATRTVRGSRPALPRRSRTSAAPSHAARTSTPPARARPSSPPASPPRRRRGSTAPPRRPRPPVARPRLELSVRPRPCLHAPVLRPSANLHARRPRWHDHLLLDEVTRTDLAEHPIRPVEAGGQRIGPPP